ncbi:uncharacterized protein LOC106635896 [Copidosoma floridanum]|uniref:uncharacterized protein LOC106635896 n=1 Tax=Copidosoma floridanum TaxID=29053 RepID=UPI0006C94907|nr:uncharacterized protein LOC106635896 [Copidosoma floridanum]
MCSVSKIKGHQTTRDYDLRDLTSALRNRFVSDEFEIVYYSVQTLLSPGESYCGILTKLDVTIHKNKDAVDESLHLVMKKINPVDRFFEQSVVFKKEVLMYTNLIPAYQNLEKELGIKGNEIINITPKYYGHQNSREENPDVVDANALLLLENLYSHGYYVCDRFSGLDFNRAKTTLSALSRYHALGIAMRQKRPGDFEKIIGQMKNQGINIVHFKNIYENHREALKNQPKFEQHFSKIEFSFRNRKNTDGPWTTITHGDLRLNNLLFRKKSSDRAEDYDVKLIDFQNCFYNSLLKDVMYFWITSLDEDTLKNRLDDLLDFYYDSFVSWLRRFDCDVEFFSKAEFEKECKEEALCHFMVSIVTLKFALHQFGEEASNHDANELANIVLQSELSEAYVKRLLMIVNIYERKEKNHVERVDSVEASEVEGNQTVNGKKEIIDVKDLTSVLQKGLKSDKLEVVHFSAQSFLIPGESYSGILAKVDVTIHRDEGDKDESLHLIMKRINMLDIFFEPQVILKREVFIYTDLIPAYQNLEKELGIKGNEIIDITPKYYGHQNSREENSDVVDANALLLLENLYSHGYYMCDRSSGLDFNRAKTTLSALSRYHALGIAMRQKRPGDFEKIISQVKNSGLKALVLENIFRNHYEALMNEPKLEQYLSKIEFYFQNCNSIDGPWTTITHGDLRLNNLLFLKKDSSRPDDIDVKTIDFQISQYESSLKDVMYFWITSLDEDTLKNRLDDLLDFYYASFMSWLRRYDCDVEFFSKAEFEKECKEQAIIHFIKSTAAMKFTLYEFIDEADECTSDELSDIVLQSSLSKAYMKRLLMIVNIYERKGWF